MDEEKALPRPDGDRPLEEVAAELSASVCPGGSDGAVDEWSIYDDSFRRLVTWALESRCYFRSLGPLKEGGKEHDLTFDPDSVSWLKFTKPSRAGYGVSFDSGCPELQPALPVEYLERLLLQNEIFADRMSFVGVSGSPVNPRIITRQPDIPGTAAPREKIVQMMCVELGFTLLPERFSLGYEDSLAFANEDVAVFDLRPANVIETADGLILPIDAIPVRLDPGSRAILCV